MIAMSLSLSERHEMQNLQLIQLGTKGANVSEWIQKSQNVSVNEFKGAVHPRNDDESEISWKTLALMESWWCFTVHNSFLELQNSVTTYCNKWHAPSLWKPQDPKSKSYLHPLCTGELPHTLLSGCMLTHFLLSAAARVKILDLQRMKITSSQISLGSSSFWTFWIASDEPCGAILGGFLLHQVPIYCSYLGEFCNAVLLWTSHDFSSLNNGWIYIFVWTVPLSCRLFSEFS